MKEKTVKNVALKLCVTAMFSALIVGGKQALAVVPNVEVVTILVATCAYVWGLSVAIPAVFTFIAVDACIWGVNTWVISYVIHWNAVALCFWGLSKLPVRSNLAKTIVAVVFAVAITLCFGVTTSCVDTLIGFTGKGFFWDFSNFATRFCAVYVAGIAFYAVQIATNAVLFSVAFLPLVLLNQKAKFKMFGESA